jgi:drug/metabolite transporter (DMT)-like permease
LDTIRTRPRKQAVFDVLRTRADLVLVVVCLVWGATFIIVKQAVADISVLLFLTLRFSIAALLLALLFGMRKRRAPLRESLRGGITAGIFLFIGYVVQTFGLRSTTAAKTGFITGLYIPLVPILGALFYRKRPRLSEALGIGLAFAGTALMTVQKDILSIGRGDLLVACSTVAYAIHILVLARYSKTADVGWLAVIQIATAAVLGWLTFWWAAPVEVHWTRAVWTGLAVTSVLATAFAFSALTWAQKYTTATRTALILSLEPVFAWLASYVAAGEVLTGRGVAGAALILVGILLAELKPFRADGHPPLK